MLILVVNCGSSSAKYQLVDVPRGISIAKGLIERIGSPDANLRHSQNAGSLLARRVNCRDHYRAIELIVETLTDARVGVIASVDEISGIGHRVVHGGERFSASTPITAAVIRSIERFSELAPLHNPPSLFGIRACAKILTGIPQVAVFDTAFHQTMPPRAYLYAIPYSYYRRDGIRRYGFHGTSHRFVSAAALKFLKNTRAKIITVHLGNGCSMAAVDGGKSVDTSMGFTPLEGLVMGTRSGDIDPAVVLFLQERRGLSTRRVNDILNKESGLLGISGESNDMRDLVAISKQKGNAGARAALAIELFIYRIRKYIGAYQAAMGGLDAVVFTGGIGENNPWLVRRVRAGLARAVTATVKFLVIPTNEELLIARDTYGIVRAKSAQRKVKR